MADAEFSKIQKEEDEVWRENEATRMRRVFVIHSLQFPYTRARWLSWLRRFLLVDALTCHEFEPHRDQFCFFFPNSNYFSYFSIFFYFNILHSILILFNIFIHALKIIKIFFPFAFIFRKCLFNL